MSTIPAFPPTPSRFVCQPATNKTRIFVLAARNGTPSRNELTAVTTVNGTHEVGNALCEALNQAVQTGDRSVLDEELASLPEAVALSCQQALDGCSISAKAVIGASGWQLAELRKTYFSPASSDIHVFAEAAMDIGLAIHIENGIDEDGHLEVVGTLFSDDAEVEHGQIDSWWPIPEGCTIAERVLPSMDEIRDALNDPRWEIYRARAYWLWVKDECRDDDVDDDYGSATAEWVVEFFDQVLSPDLERWVFVTDDSFGEDDRGFLTARTRLLLWLSLGNIAGDLEMLVADWEGWDSQVRDDMPAFTRDQPREWWAQMCRSAYRLCEAARCGELDELEPRTAAEEALISLATRAGYIDWARDSVADRGLEGVYNKLPVTADDEVWEEILGQLTGDTDIEMLWSSRLAHQADPTDSMNRFLGMGDYRPKAWHRLFDRAVNVLPDVGPAGPGA